MSSQDYLQTLSNTFFGIHITETAKVPTQDYIRRVGHMPNDLQASDHISLVGDFSFCKSNIDTDSAQNAKSNDKLSSWPSLGASDKVVDNKAGSIPSWPLLAEGNGANRNGKISSNIQQKKKRAPYKLSLGNY